MNQKIIQAASLAKKAHTGQKYGDEDYFTGHIERVVNKARLLFSDNKAIDQILVIAYLHDILEDTTVTYDDVALEFGKYTASCVKLLTKRENQPNDFYIDCICDNPITTAVKYADSYVNLEKCLETQQWKRSEKYLKNLQRLSKYLQ